ncbi:TonB-dependent receptor [Salinimicrobium flavum]|uniref:Carboxypeptidase-like regulatory domain-containing protein n=1 Tax=Salinimicrobium flavum TaxID=1737065 RepID=A0ABW5IYQ2_9FLAO
MKASQIFIFLCLLYGNSLFSQTAVITGVVLDENEQPIPSANILIDNGIGTQTSQDGYYELKVPAGVTVSVTFSHISFSKIKFDLLLQPGETLEFNPVMMLKVEQISEVPVTGARQEVQGITVLDPETIRNIPGANAGVENLLKSLPGVYSNNELSTQYAVRGGNYDENLVYVNGVEIYRPFLIRSGQQEGLSFVNPALVRKVHFSAGGFQARYGDKLSSVLDITYRRPVEFRASLDAGLLGSSISAEGISKNGKFMALGGVRYRDNSLFVEAKQTETNFHPVFADAQANLIYMASPGLEVSFLGNLSLNNYNYEPLTRQTKFGTLQDPKALMIYYRGQEKDTYRTWFGALNTSYLVNENYTAGFIASAYNTREQEYFDIVAQYRMVEVNADIGGGNFGKVDFTEGVGGQLTHARNKLDALIINFEHKGNLKFGESGGHQIDYGLKYSHEDIRDRIQEYEIVDSAGFSVRPPLPHFVNNQPYEPFTAPLEPYNSIRAFNETTIHRVQGFLQWSKRSHWRQHEIWFNTGIRSHSWQVEAEDHSSSTKTVISPRAQFAIKPDWEKDMLFRLSGGVYYQPPFYRELRSFTGELNAEVDAQRALHLVLGQDYSFRWMARPFKLSTEIYYKDLSDVNPYTLENVRIRYAAKNNATAYAYGMDLRLNGEFVAGTESWLSFGYLKSEENIENKGYIARPTDQRLKFAIMFQDQVPKVPDLKMFLNLVYNTGLPGGSPSYSDPYLYQSRLPDYKRADLGISYALQNKNTMNPHTWLRGLEEISIGLEIFNIFDTQNSITNSFVRDVYSKVQYAVPNYLTPRVFNVKLGIKI